MSTGGSYLNSNVSLISKASIRYEGTLYSINPQEATITLSNVKSYGTEDRKVEKYLAPKDTLFEYIIFKANDIKELIVDEPLNDPAIVTAQMPASASGGAFSGFGESQSNVQSNGLTDAQATLNGITSSNNQQPSAPSVSSTGQAGDRFRSRGSTPASSQARSPVSELSSQNNKLKTDLNKAGTRNLNNNAAGNAPHHQQNRANNYQQRRTYDNNNRMNNNYNNNNTRLNRNSNYNNQPNRRPGNYNSYQNNGFGRGAQSDFRRYDDRMSNNMNNRNNFNRNNNYPMNNNRGMRGPPRKYVPHSNKKFDATLKTEFDFEKANELFEKMVDKLEDLSIQVNNEKGEKSGSEDKDENKSEIEKSDQVDEDGNFYDKTKSFFDNISCEAIERTKGNQKKFDWKQERKLNAETFGLKITYRRNDGSFYRRPGNFISNNRNLNQNRRFNNGPHNPQQQRNAPRTNSS